MDNANIILVEDDAALREGLVEYLKLSGFSISSAATAVEFFEILTRKVFRVAIIDLGLPDIPGRQLVEYLRRNTTTSIVVLTAHNTLDTRIDCYQQGTDIFLSKPVDARELTAAVRSLITRQFSVGTSTANCAPAQSVWELQPQLWTLRSPNGATIRFTAKEFEFIALLASSPGESVGRKTLCLALYGREDSSAEAALATLVKRVRQRIERAAEGAQPILTAHGVGYRFAAILDNGKN